MNSDSIWRDWHGTALVVGCGGIGQALLKELGEIAPGLLLVGASRQDWRLRQKKFKGDVEFLPLDLTDDSSLSGLAAILEKRPPLRLVINTAGLLHGPDLQPEKRLSQVNRQALERSFAVNAFAPLLLAKAIESLFSFAEPFHFASLSARVGSISDNKLGGWYAYRAAKAAQNQMLRTLALEWARKRPRGCVSLLHPGTTATALSAPFQAGVPSDRLFSPERAAKQLLDVLTVLEPQHTGQFWAWDGQQIAW
ncbi:MAG: SDR family NAD(P)-dependent oxidoreductase [Cyanobacteria bacterium]|nr:SDR family NAD(P)-dependent oxidoreductase [Cyanobacteriota bacterium]